MEEKQGDTNIDKSIIFRISLMLLGLIIISLIIYFENDMPGIAVLLMLSGLIFATLLYLNYEHYFSKKFFLEELDFYKIPPNSMPNSAKKNEIDYFGMRWNIWTWKKYNNDHNEVWVDPNPICINKNNNKVCQTPLIWNFSLLTHKFTLSCPTCKFKEIISLTIEEYLDEIIDGVTPALSN